MATSRPRPSKHGSSDAFRCVDRACDLMCHRNATRAATVESPDAAAAIPIGAPERRAGISGLATPREAAEYLRTTVGKLANDRNRGSGPAYAKYGRSVLYPWDALQAFIEECTIGDD